MIAAETKSGIQAIVNEWRIAASTMPLDDLDAAFDHVDKFEALANRAIMVSTVDTEEDAEVREELEDVLRSAFDEAYHALDEMIGKGWADPGKEELVQDEIEDQILPRLEDAIAEWAD